MKVKCPRCNNGTGYIQAFSHVLGGVCFKCGGSGYVERKTAPKQQFWFTCFAYFNGEFLQLQGMKAASETQALSKWKAEVQKRISRGFGYSLDGLRVELDKSRVAS